MTLRILQINTTSGFEPIENFEMSLDGQKYFDIKEFNTDNPNSISFIIKRKSKLTPDGIAFWDDIEKAFKIIPEVVGVEPNYDVV